MANVIKLRKGLDIRLKGTADMRKIQPAFSDDFGFVPDDFVGVKPKVVVDVGDRVLAGDTLFVNKRFPEVRFASSVSGVVTDVVRGERRKVLCVKVKADKEPEFRDFGKMNLPEMDGN